MTNEELNKLLKPFGKTIEDLIYDYSDFKTEASAIEGCPECTCENEIKQDGTSDCEECGHKEVLPCSECPLNDLSLLCDWDKETRCSPFPKEKK
jgi:hypothetical protein